ncbi:YceI family protein [uncultured Aquimarina sp.]|uniref:YceI family protein n=1 Tax=uncultured Aquimarina sp. TaxID=575652 RepID=UPI0026354522|nr:YceI family protein [uncultured Aquimarina sp.]
MKRNTLLLLLLTLSCFTSCNTTQKEENKPVLKVTATTNESLENSSTYAIDINTSTTTYIGSKPTGKHNGKIFIKQGNFKVKEGNIIGGSVTLDMTSITVDDLNDKEESQGKNVLLTHLKSKDFLDVVNHPTGTFTIHAVNPYNTSSSKENKEEFDSKFKPLSNDENSVVKPTHIMTGDLTLRGVTKNISFPVRIEAFNTKLKVQAKFNIDRTDYNINYGEETSVADKIKDKFIYNTVNLGFNVEALNPTVSEEDPTLAPKIIDVFEKKFGIHEGKRRNHISGFCFSGYLSLKDAKIGNYSKSNVFSKKPLKVMGRFSHKGGAKKDESAPGEYGMAFEVTLADGTTHNFSMNTLDFFPVSTPEGFMQLMQAKLSGKSEDFEKLKQDHPEFKNYKTHYKNKPKERLKNYANHRFNSVNTFLFEDANGKKTPVRWAFIPRNEEITMDTSKKVDFYADMSMLLRKQKELHWDMEVTIANENDPINDAAKFWDGEHKKIVAATLTVTDVMMEGSCDVMNFDPLALQEGILPSDDPILKFRSPTYAAAFVRRLQEKKHMNK